MICHVFMHCCLGWCAGSRRVAATMLLLSCVAASAGAPAAPAANDCRQFDPSYYAPDAVIERDFAIVGGGASGTYAAVALADRNETFVLVEVSDRLGGNARSFHDAAAGVSVDFGVQIHLDSPVVRDFFARLDAPLVAGRVEDFGLPRFYDFERRLALPGYARAGIQPDYVAQLDRWPYVDNLAGLPNPVPPDLLLTWPEYAVRHNLSRGSAEGGLAWPATPGDLLGTTALSILNGGNRIEVAEFSGSAVRGANHSNTAIYDNALAELAPHVLLRSSVVAARRGPTRGAGVRLVARTPGGNKLIVARQLVVAMPPVPENTGHLGLDGREADVLARISGKYFYGGVVNNTGLHPGVAYTNAGSDTRYHVARLPGVVAVCPTAFAGYQFYWYNTVEAKTRAEVEGHARDTIKWLQAEDGAEDLEPRFLDYQDYSPFRLSPPVEDIADGWYSRMDGLQGYRNTWYISALFVVGSTQIWNNTLNMLPDIISAAKSCNVSIEEA